VFFKSRKIFTRQKRKPNMAHRSILRTTLIIGILSMLIISQASTVFARGNVWAGIGSENRSTINENETGTPGATDTDTPTLTSTTTPTPTYTSTPTPCAEPTGTGLLGRYYAYDGTGGNALWTNMVYIRTDPTVNFNWGPGSPNAAIPIDNFHVRWTGKIYPPYPGSYTFYTQSDDGTRLTIDAGIDINNWVNQSPTIKQVTLNLACGAHNIQLDYFESSGGAMMKLGWYNADLARTQPTHIFNYVDSYSTFVAIPSMYLVPPEGTPQPTSTYVTPTPTTTYTPSKTLTRTLTYTPSKTSSPTTTYTPSKTYTPSYTPTATYTPSQTNTSTLTRVPTSYTPTDSGYPTPFPPGAFAKISPGDSAAGITISPILNWEPSSSVGHFEYCYDTTNDNACDGNWISVWAYSATLSGLSYNTTYYWQVQAVNSTGRAYADNDVWWNFTTSIAPPGAFTKVSPVHATTGETIQPVLNWETSNGAANYEYCYDTTNDATCSGIWTDSGINTHAELSGLNYDTTYYWQVRAINTGGTTHADGGTWWSFTTSLDPSGGFTKLDPVNAAAEVAVAPTLYWKVSSQATGYEYCYDTIDNTTCDGTWTSAGTSTSATLSGLNDNTTYYWQVRAINLGGTIDANGGTWWNFTTLIDPPELFTKISPANADAQVDISLTLSWGTSNRAAGYEYCYDTSNNNACNGTWTSAGTNTSVNLIGLSKNIIYYWQVQAINAGGTTYADENTWWSFATLVDSPGAFYKYSPANAATDIIISPTIRWYTSSNASSYEYCYDTSNDNACDGIWISTGTNYYVTLNELSYSTTYYWQVRAVNASGTTYANDNTWWSFTTSIAPPEAFHKITPANLVTGAVIPQVLSWSTSGGTIRYEYCYDTTQDALCSGTWTSTGTNTSVTLSGLGYGTIYYWQVRAINGGGTTYADDTTWWNFTTFIGADAWIRTGLTIATYSLAIDPATPTTIYAGTFNHGMYKSTNSGRNWNAVNTGMTGGTGYSLVIDPTTPTTLYVGTYTGGIFKSTNGGGNWSAVNTGIANSAVYALAIDPITPATLYAGTYGGGGGVFKSTNAGGNWNLLNLGISATFIKTIAIDPQIPTTLYAGVPDNGVYKSTNGGENWSAVNTGLSNIWIADLAIDPTTPTTLYAGTYGGVFKSTNGGENWNLINTGMSATSIRTIVIDPKTPTTLYAGTQDGGVFKSINGGKNWSTFNMGLLNIDVEDLAIDTTLSPTLYAGTYYGGIFSVRTASPAPFDKSIPANSTTGIATNPTFHWETSSAATSYEYCYDTINDNACSGTWISTGTDTSVTLSGLSNNMTYYWQVRAVGVNGETHANAGTWWSFTTIPIIYKVFAPLLTR
jgi:photosystem II stability/assembly factor-like uncharacterized protein